MDRILSPVNCPINSICILRITVKIQFHHSNDNKLFLEISSWNRWPTQLAVTFGDRSPLYQVIPYFRCAFSCMVQYSLCHGMGIGTCHIVHWSAAPYYSIAYRTGFGVCVCLLLKVIRCSCHYFLDRILFHHDFHHDSCEYHRDFNGH